MYNFRCVDNSNNNMNYNSNVNVTGMECPVVYECPIERVCHREIHHHVPQDCHFMIDDNSGFISTS